jgi:sarcosine oxidase subunit beta
MAQVLVAGAGAIGASVAYHLALAGATDVVLADRGTVAGGATGKAFGGVRQQFSTAAEVVLARESLAFFRSLGPALFQQVGYLFLATSEAELDVLESRYELQCGLGVTVERVGPERIQELARGVAVDDVLGGTFGAEDGLSDPGAVTRELVRRANGLGVELREGVAAETIAADTIVIACGAHSAEIGLHYGVELPVRPVCRQLLETEPVEGLDERLPLVIESGTGFHFRRRGESVLIAMADESPRWGFAQEVEESVFADRLARLARRLPPAAGTRIARAWAGLYDMTPDAHPIVGCVADGVYAACGFSGHGFMQSPAVGRALAAEILGEEPAFDLSPYRLERFAEGTVFPEQVVL